MAGDWTKVCKGLSKKPEVIRIAGIVGIDRYSAAQRCIDVWDWADDEIPDENFDPETLDAVTKMSPSAEDNCHFIDDVAGYSGFAKAMIEVGWLKLESGVVVFPRLGRHAGSTAKTRARNALNKKKKRIPSPQMSSFAGDKKGTPSSLTLNSSVMSSEGKGGGGGKGEKFEPPSVAEVAAYCAEKSLTVEPEAFVDFYQSKGWMVGKNKMKDWKASCRNWAKRDLNKSGDLYAGIKDFVADG